MAPSKVGDPARLNFRLSRVLNHQAQVHLTTGDLAQAEPLLAKAIEFEKYQKKIDHECVAESYIILSDIYYKFLIDLDHAESTLQEAFFHAKELPQESNRVLISTILHLLGQLYHTGGAYDYAERNYLYALKVARKIGGGRSPKVASILSSLGALFEFKGDLQKSEAYLREALDITREIHGDFTPESANILNNLARQAAAAGRYGEAGSMLRKGLEIVERHGQDPVVWQNLLYNLAEVDAATGNAPQALAGFERALAADARLLAESFLVGSERQRLSRLANSQFRAGQLLSLVLRDFRNDPRAVRLAGDQMLSRKGLVADALINQRNSSAGDFPELHAELRKLAELRARIARDSLAGPGPEGPKAHRKRLAEEMRWAEEQEIRIARGIPKAGFDAVLWADVTSRVARFIPPGAALVEFLRYNSFDFSPNRCGEVKNFRTKVMEHQTSRYAAFVLLPEEPEQPRLYDLGEAAIIDRVIEHFRSIITGEAGPDDASRAAGPDTQVSNAGQRSERHLGFDGTVRKLRPICDIRDAGRSLFQTVFAPLLETLGDRTRLFLSPDGALNRLPFEALPLDGDRWVIDAYFITYLGVGRDIIQHGATKLIPLSASLVLADPDFDLGGPPPASAPHPYISFERLRGTLREGEMVAQLLGVAPLTGEAALESRLKACRSPVVLHLATHGFVLNYKPRPVLNPIEMKEGTVITESDPNRRMIALLVGDDGLPLPEGSTSEGHLVSATPPRSVDAEREDQFIRLSGQELNNPLTRSGLALAGANSWLTGGVVPIEAEDGILSAEDVTGMDLRGTELVVLSACESGLGEVHAGEGVFGLRRAFFLAGARTLVMSLWKVPDEPTRELMEAFYRRVVAGGGRGDSLRKAQLAIRSVYPSPYYWSAFICQGDSAPLPSTQRAE